MQAVAAAVASVCLRPEGVAPSTGTGRPAGPRAEANAPDVDAADVDLSTLIGQVRSKRAARRNAKKARRRAAKQEAQASPPVVDQVDGEELAWKLLDGGAADLRPAAGGGAGAVSAQALPRPPDGAASPQPPTGTPAQSMPPSALSSSEAVAHDAARAAALSPEASEGSACTLGRESRAETRTLGRGSASASLTQVEMAAPRRKDTSKVLKRRT